MKRSVKNQRGQAHLPNLRAELTRRVDLSLKAFQANLKTPRGSARSQEGGLAPAVPCFLVLLSFLLLVLPSFSQAQTESLRTEPHYEYLWYEAENMRGFGTKPNGEPIQNPSWMDLPRAKAPGWGINGPGVSAEWSQGGESEWNSAAASADESVGKIYQDLEIPRGGNYKVWVRYADWANRTENFTIRIMQGEREIFRHEFGAKDIIDPHDEVSMYWGWAFTWDGASAQIEKGPARLTVEIEKPAEARRHIDCVLLTNDPAYVPSERRKPDFAAARYLREWSTSRTELSSLLQPTTSAGLPPIPIPWQRPKLSGTSKQAIGRRSGLDCRWISRHSGATTAAFGAAM